MSSPPASRWEPGARSRWRRVSRWRSRDEQTLTDNGALSFGTGDTVDLSTNYAGTAQILVAGSLTAAGTTFNSGTGTASNITVNSGGTITPTTSTFNLPLFLPYVDVPSLAGNTSFDQVEIESGTLSTGTLALNLIGTNPTNLSYVFPAGFTVGPGGTMTVAAGVTVAIPGEQTLTDNGTLTFGTGDTVDLSTNYAGTAQILVGGSLTAAGTTFNSGTGTASNITVNSGGIITPTTSTFNLPLFLPYVDVPSLAGNTSFDQVEIESGTLSTGTLALNLIGTNPTNLSYVFPAGFTVGPGGTMTVAAGVTVAIAGQQTLTDNGALSFGTGDTVDLSTNYAGTAQILVAGSLTASGTTFNSGTGTASNITVNTGGTITPTTSTFNLPLFLPYNDVPSLAGNTSFDQVEIESGTISSGTLALNLIGTNPTNLSYVFPAGFTVDSGGTMTVAAGVTVAIPGQQTLTDNGMLSFATGDTVDLSTNYAGTAQIVVGGTLTASGTTFDSATGTTSNIQINSGGIITASDNTFDVLPLALNSGSTATLQFNTFTGQLSVNSGATIDIEGNDFSKVGNNGVIAAGSASAQIILENNYWGTTDTTAIGKLILDHNDNAQLPTIVFEPVWSSNSGTLASPASALYSSSAQSINLTAAVSTTGGIPITGGTETFTILNGSVTVGQATSPQPVSGGTVTAAYQLPAGTAVGKYTIEASYSGYGSYPALTDTSQFLTISPSATQVAITSSALSLIAGNTGEVTVQLEDASGNPAASATAQTINLSTTSGSGGFYANQSLSDPITSVVISPGQTSASFYYEDTLAGTPTLTANDTALGSAPTQQEAVSPAAVNSFTVTTNFASPDIAGRRAP